MMQMRFGIIVFQPFYLASKIDKHFYDLKETTMIIIHHKLSK